MGRLFCLGLGGLLERGEPYVPTALLRRDSEYKKSCPLVDLLDSGDSGATILKWPSPETEEASAPSTETRPLSREYWRAHYTFRCLSKIVSRRDNRMLPIDVDNRMNIWLFNREKLVIVTALCWANDWLQLAHWHHLVSSTRPSASTSTMSSTVSMVHHHLHSPPRSITCENGRDIRASDHRRSGNKKTAFLKEIGSPIYY
jgi:hypothetical protein